MNILLLFSEPIGLHIRGLSYHVWQFSMNFWNTASDPGSRHDIYSNSCLFQRELATDETAALSSLLLVIKASV